MEKYSLKNDIKVFYVTASSFPGGIKEAYEKLSNMLPSVKERKFFGISHPQNGKIIYKAPVRKLKNAKQKNMDAKLLLFRMVNT